MTSPTPALVIEQSLEAAVARIGDPAPRVYERLFRQAPELEALFVNDRNGSVRAEMFMKSIDVVLDLVGPGHYAQSLVATEWVNHRNLGVPMAHFGSFFEAVAATLREGAGAQWTTDMDTAWAAALNRLHAVIDDAARACA